MVRLVLVGFSPKIMVGGVRPIPMDVETPSLIDSAIEEATHLAGYDV
jgi:hypothetical protein